MTKRGMVHRLRSDRGQAIVEFVIVLPLMFAMIFVIAYAAVGFDRYLRVTDAARIGARAAAVARFNGQTPCPAATAAATAAMGGLPITVVCPAAPAGQFTVTVTYDLNVGFPLLSRYLLPGTDEDIQITSTVTERLE